MEEKALEFARKAHADQKRKYNDEDYIEHPKRGAETVKTVPHTPEMIAAAYLHDVVEDTPVTDEDIQREFGSTISGLVHELTDEYVKENYQQLNRRRRKEKEVERQGQMSPQAKTIKLADVIDNTMDIVRNDPNFARRYIPEMENLTHALKGGNEELLKRAFQEIKLGKKILRKSSRQEKK